VTTVFKVTLLQEAVADLQRLEDFAIERELESETPDWNSPQRACSLGRPTRAARRIWATAGRVS
jgi:hypothetical protein